jgi:peptidylprolyl isomerase
MHLRALPALAALVLPAGLAAQETQPPTPASVVAEAPAEEWVEIAADDLLVMELAPDAAGRPRRVVIQLLPAPFSQLWVENIRTLARAHWWDGTSVYRVVDNWVAQWGDGEEEKADAKPLPPGLNVAPESAYTLPEVMLAWSLPLTEHAKHLCIMAPCPPGTEPLLQASRWEGSVLADLYAGGALFRQGWPLGFGEHRVWPVHCYAHVGVARDLSPDTGTGAELYGVMAMRRASSIATSRWSAG